MIIQVFMEGSEYSFDISNDFNGRTVTAAVKQKIKMRSKQIRDMRSKTSNYRNTLSILVVDGGILDHLMLIFLKDVMPCILELNPRFGGGYPITHYAGLDFTILLIGLFQGTVNPDYSKYYDLNSTNKCNLI